MNLLIEKTINFLNKEFLISEIFNINSTVTFGNDDSIDFNGGKMNTDNGKFLKLGDSYVTYFKPDKVNKDYIVRFEFNVNDNMGEVSYSFSSDGGTTFNIFERSASASTNVIKIFNSILFLLKKVLEKVQPKYISFASVEHTRELYKRIMSKRKNEKPSEIESIIKTLGYKFFKVTQRGEESLYIFEKIENDNIDYDKLLDAFKKLNGVSEDDISYMEVCIDKVKKGNDKFKQIINDLYNAFK